MIRRAFAWLLDKWDVALVLILGWIVGLLIFAGPAFSQGQRCGPRLAIVERLADRFGETPQAMGLAANNAVVEVFASLETGTWTITVTGTNGLMCLVASGTSYDALAPALEGDPL